MKTKNSNVSRTKVFYVVIPIIVLIAIGGIFYFRGNSVPQMELGKKIIREKADMKSEITIKKFEISDTENSIDLLINGKNVVASSGYIGKPIYIVKEVKNIGKTGATARDMDFDFNQEAVYFIGNDGVEKDEPLDVKTQRHIYFTSNGELDDEYGEYVVQPGETLYAVTSFGMLYTDAESKERDDINDYKYKVIIDGKEYNFLGNK